MTYTLNDMMDHSLTHTLSPPDSAQMVSCWPLAQTTHAWTSTAPVTPVRMASLAADIAGAYPVPSRASTGHMTHATYRQAIVISNTLHSLLIIGLIRLMNGRHPVN